MPAVTHLGLNCFGVGFTPTGGVLTPMNKTSNCSINKGAQNVSFSGDNDHFPTFRTMVMQDPSVTFSSGDIGLYLGLVPGVYGTLTFTVGDAKNGVGAGSMTFTLVNAMIDDGGGQVPHAALATATTTFVSYSSDGTTNPLSYTFN